MKKEKFSIFPTLVTRIRNFLTPEQKEQKRLYDKKRYEENKEREKRALASLDIIDAQKDSATMVIRATGKAEAMKKEQQNLSAIYVEYIKWSNANPDVARVPQYMGNTSGLILNTGTTK
mgnify:CR=1 FL=1